MCLGQDEAGDFGCRVRCTDPGAGSHTRSRGSGRLPEERQLLDVIS